MGIPVSGKNIFPSNISGLPTWYNIRVSKEGYTAFRRNEEILILMNQDTFAEDLNTAKPGAVIVYNDKLTAPNLPKDHIYYPIPFQEIVNAACDVVALRKLVINMVYVGVASELFSLDLEKVKLSLEKQFHSKPKAVELNWKAILAGVDYVKKNLQKKDPYKLEPMNKTKGKILITGNEAVALGCLFGGCTVFTWYPITPASSVGEAITEYFSRFRKEEDGRAKFVVVQAEDELAAVGMAIGAGWAGARAATSTSGPGLSLMAEFTGLGFYAELPCVIFDIQRLGPSTGLPTRTSQGDILFTHFLSHGDTQHLVLLPCNAEECFDLSMEAFNLAEEFQTPVFVLSDLDIGMNNWMAEPFSYPKVPFRRGKVLTAEQLEKLGGFKRYGDVDGDGIPYRTLPGTKHPKASYFTRGSGHNEEAKYTEKSEVWKRNLDRLARKFETARKRVPQPVVDQKGGKIGIIAYGSSNNAIIESRDQLTQKGITTNYLRLRALPFTGAVKEFLEKQDRVYVVEQNQQGQMTNLLRMDLPEYAAKIRPVLHYDGMPLDANTITSQIEMSLRGTK